MASSLFSKMRLRRAVKKFKTTLDGDYAPQEDAVLASPAGNGLIAIRGQVYPGPTLDGPTEVVNVGRPASAIYAVKRGSSGVVSVVGSSGSSGGGGGGTTNPTDFLRKDGSEPLTGNLIVNPGVTIDGVDIGTHVTQDYIEGHPTSNPLVNRRQEYWSRDFDIVGGSTIDESANLLNMFNIVGAAGGGILHINALTPGDPIRLDKLVSIYYNNMDVRFSPATPLSLGAAGGLRMMGSLDEYTAPGKFAGKLDADALEGTKEFVLAGTGGSMDGGDIAVGNQLIGRGQNGPDGESLQKQIVNVVAIATDTLTLAQELEYDFLTDYPLSDYPDDQTTIYIVRTVNLAADAARGDMELSVSNLEDATVGDLYRISDGRNEHDLNAAAIRGTLAPYENDCNMEFVRIVAKSGSSSGGTVTLDRPLSNDYLSTTPYFGALAHVLPVVNSRISGARISYYEDQVSKNAHALAMGFCMDCSIEDCTVDGYLTDTTGKWSQAVRIADSFNCWGRRLIARGAPQTDSSEGYQFTHYKATGGGFENCEAYDGRHNYLVQASVLFTIRNCQSHNDHISGFDLHGANERDGVIENCLATRSNLHTSDASNGALYRPGNTSHAVGCHYIKITNCKAIGAGETNIAAIDILPASSNILVDGFQAEGCYYGIKFTRNSAQCQPVQSASNIIFQNCQLSNIIDRAVYIQCEPTADDVVTVGRADYWTLKGITLHNTLEHFHIDGDGGITDLTIEDCSIVQPIVSPANNFYGYNISGVTNLVIRDSSAHGCSRGISYTSCAGVTIVHNTLTLTVDTMPLVDGGSNTGTITIEANSPGVGGVSQWTAVTGGIAYASGKAGVNTGAVALVGTIQLGGAMASLVMGSAAAETGPYEIAVLASASATVATKGTGHGRNLLIAAGASDNSSGKSGGDLYLKGGDPASPATIIGDVYISHTGGRVRVGNQGAYADATLDVARGTGADGTAWFNGTDYTSAFAVGANENTTITAGKDAGTVYINPVATGDVRLADGGGNIYVNGTLLSTYIAIANDSITFAKLQNISTDRLIGRDTAGTGDAEEISVGGGLEFTGTAEIRRSALTGDVTAAAASNATTIANDAVTFAKMQNIATARLLGRNTASTGDIEELTAATVIAMLGQWVAVTGGIGYAGGKVMIGSGNPATLLNLVDTNATIRFGAAGAADSSVFAIDVAGSGSSTNSGHGRNIVITAGAADNASGKIGGSVLIRPGAVTAPATQIGDIYLADLGGLTKVGGNSAPTATLDVARQTVAAAPDGTAVFRGGTYATYINFATDQHTYIRGGLSTSRVILGDVNAGVTIGNAGANVLFELTDGSAMPFQINEGDNVNTVRWNSLGNTIPETPTKLTLIAAGVISTSTGGFVEAIGTIKNTTTGSVEAFHIATRAGNAASTLGTTNVQLTVASDGEIYINKTTSSHTCVVFMWLSYRLA